MTFEGILGQETAIGTLRAALASGRVHHAYRFEGPAGVGKELAALKLAQALLCKTRSACGECSPCRRVVKFAAEPPHVPLHPDVILIGRGLYSGTLLNSKEASGISVEQIRKLVLGRVGFPPHEGNALVVIVRDAEELTTSAANALLKTLEEPHRDVHFVLLTSRPNRLLDTVRSRTLAVRFGPLPEPTIREILRRHGLDESVAAFAQGSADRALRLAESDEQTDLEQFAAAIDKAVTAPSLVPALDLAGELPRERDALESRLLNYAQLLALHNRTLVGTDPDRAVDVTTRYRAVQRALDALERNAAPAVTFESMIAEMRG